MTFLQALTLAKSIYFKTSFHYGDVVQIALSPGGFSALTLSFPLKTKELPQFREYLKSKTIL